MEKSVNFSVTMCKAGCKRKFDKFSLHSNQKKSCVSDVLANETTNAKFYSLHFKLFCLFGKIITLRPGNLIDGKTL